MSDVLVSFSLFMWPHTLYVCVLHPIMYLVIFRILINPWGQFESGCKPFTCILAANKVIWSQTADENAHIRKRDTKLCMWEVIQTEGLEKLKLLWWHITKVNTRNNVREEYFLFLPMYQLMLICLVKWFQCSVHHCEKQAEWWKCSFRRCKSNSDGFRFWCQIKSNEFQRLCEGQINTACSCHVIFVGVSKGGFLVQFLSLKLHSVFSHPNLYTSVSS